jgi:hypothetical protein
MSLLALKTFISDLRVTESTWKFVTSAGGDLTIGTPVVHVGANATGGALWLQKGASGRPVRFTFGGIGGSASLSLVPFPGNFSFSIPQMPSSGVVYKLPYAGGTLSESELRGAFVEITVAGDAGPGYGQSLMFIGGNVALASVLAVAPGLGTFLQLTALLATSNACVRFGGMSATLIPYNIGLSAYIGVIG